MPDSQRQFERDWTLTQQISGFHPNLTEPLSGRDQSTKLGARQLGYVSAQPAKSRPGEQGLEESTAVDFLQEI
jgi:hypothetical protein